MKYLGIEKYIFADTYNLFIKYCNTELIDDNAWEQCDKDAQRIIEKYKGHRLAKNLIMNVMEQLQHKSSNLPLDGLTHSQWENILTNSHQAGF